LKTLTKGIFIHKIAYSESSYIVVFYTENLGLQRFIFQGGKKKAALLFPCSLCEIGYYKRADSELGTLVYVASFVLLKCIPFSPVYSTVAFFYADVLRNVLKGESKDKGLFDFLKTYIPYTDELLQHELPMAVLYFLIKLLSKLGVEPKTNNKIQQYFYLESGIFSNNDNKHLLSHTGVGVKLIQEILLNMTVTQISKEAEKEALTIIIFYYEIHIQSFKVNRTLEILRAILYD
jgi:DNA repair protein RecO (recombination protein O)